MYICIQVINPSSNTELDSQRLRVPGSVSPQTEDNGSERADTNNGQVIATDHDQ